MAILAWPLQIRRGGAYLICLTWQANLRYPVYRLPSRDGPSGSRTPLHLSGVFHCPNVHRRFLRDNDCCLWHSRRMAHRGMIRVDERDFPRLMNILRAKGFSEKEVKESIRAVREFMERQSMRSPKMGEPTETGGASGEASP